MTTKPRHLTGQTGQGMNPDDPPAMALPDAPQTSLPIAPLLQPLAPPAGQGMAPGANGAPPPPGPELPGGTTPAPMGTPPAANAMPPQPGPGAPPPAAPLADHAAQISYRSIDGSGNNLADTSMNAAGQDFDRIGPARFADGVDAIITTAPNARTISNIVVAGNGDLANPEKLSGMMYAWGQFVDHDINLTNSDGKTHIDITIPAGDPDLTASKISMTRAVIDPATGINGTPALALNNVTGWLDASQVYGSNATTAASLRSADGHMLTSDGDNLPIVNGMYAAGDGRAAENPDLTALQVLFVREHNFQVDRLAAEHPSWTGDQLYQQARAIVTAEIAHITYSEFLTHLLGPGVMTAYAGYKANVDATISEEFAGAAFRFGHSIVSANLSKIDEQGSQVGDAVTLKDAFFQAPADFVIDGGAAGLLRHLAGDLSNALDVHIVDDLRNFLDVPPVAMDLAAINIQRGRDLGLGTLNQTREALGLKAYTDFSQITSDTATAAALKSAYGSVDEVDLWTGGLAENHMKGAMIGETFGIIIAHTFEDLRDGDRFWYQNQGFDAKELAAIEHTTLSDLIIRNTDTEHMQDDAFVFYNRVSGAAGGVEAEHPEDNQLIIGSDGHDTLTGGVGNDMLVAGSGEQLLTGGKGADTFVIDAAGTRATITDFRPGEDKLDFGDATKGGLMLRAQGHDTIIDLADIHVVLQGLTPAELGRAGLEGLHVTALYGAGDDVVRGGDDRLTIDAGAGNNDIHLTGRDNDIRAGHGDNTVFAAGGHATLHLGDGANNIATRGDGNALFLGDGVNHLVAQAGDGTALHAGNGGNTIELSSWNNHIATGQGADKVWAGLGMSDIDTGAGDDTVWIGGSGGSHVRTGAGEDVIYTGGALGDTLDGGAGNDQYVIRDASAVVIEQAGAAGGFDTAWVGVDGWTLAANVEIGRLFGTASSLVGSAGDDVLVANAVLASRLDGRGGNDVLWGGMGADTLMGGAGDDIMIGGLGGDLFVFGTGQGQDAVRDFSRAQGDHIGLSTPGGFAALSIDTVGGNSVLHLGAASVTLYGVTGLVASDFIFG
jgi:Ca2+-binding RTX toxin-like protein